MVELVAYRYRIPLQPRLELRGSSLSLREGVLIGTSLEADVWADAAPLPGYSRESFQQVIECLQDDLANPPASVRFALDCLRLPVSQASSVPVNALLLGEPESVRQQVEVICESDFSVVKMKVGRSRVSEEIALVRHVRSRLRNDQSLRLDANRSWDLHQATEFGQGVADLAIDYIEEPTYNPLEFEAFLDRTSVPYALDETLVDTKQIEGFRNAAALIIKPTLLGGRADLDDLAQHGIPMVFSSCFESGVGVLNIARLAAHYSPDVASGLDTYRWIDRDVLVDRLTMSEGSLSLLQQIRVDPTGLEAINL